jgi:hypothetical protein
MILISNPIITNMITTKNSHDNNSSDVEENLEPEELSLLINHNPSTLTCK